jgi:FtsP/CotA-like multicopper oxidase with cupredoxin domain
MKFEDHAGLYLYHCHILEHEDLGMMRNYRVEAKGA